VLLFPVILCLHYAYETFCILRPLQGKEFLLVSRHVIGFLIPNIWSHNACTSIAVQRWLQIVKNKNNLHTYSGGTRAD